MKDLTKIAKNFFKHNNGEKVVLITTDGQVFKADAQGRNSAKNYLRGKKGVEVKEFKKGSEKAKKLEEKEIVTAVLPQQTQDLLDKIKELEIDVKLGEKMIADALEKEKALTLENSELREANVDGAKQLEVVKTELKTEKESNRILISTNNILATENKALKKAKKPTAKPAGGNSKTPKNS